MSRAGHLLTVRSRIVRGQRRAGLLPGQTFFEGRIGHAEDDAYEILATGAVSTADEVLRLGTDQAWEPLLAGVRWRDVGLNQGESIEEARIRFHTWSSGNLQEVHLRIWGQAADDAAAFAEVNDNLSTRPKTTAYVDWDVPAWSSGTSGEHTTTPDLSPIVQEIVNRPGWVPGNSLVFLVELTPGQTLSEFPRRRAWGFSGSAEDAAFLRVNDPDPDPGDPSEPPGELVPTDLDMRGNPNFDRLDLDHSSNTTDEWGRTQRDWFDICVNVLNDIGPWGDRNYRHYRRSEAFNRTNWRTWNRTGSAWMFSLLAVLRVTGDLRFLDEGCRLMELAWANQTLITEGAGAGYIGWESNRTIQDRILGWGVVSQIMWACKNNEDLVSPAGHDYGALGQKYHSWLINHAFPSAGTSGLPVHRKAQQHTYVQMMRAQWYVAKAGGGYGFSPEQYRAATRTLFDEKDVRDVVCNDHGFGGRNNRVWRHNVYETSTGGWSESTNGCTYTRLEVAPYVDLFIEEAYPEKINLTFLQDWAATLSDHVFDNDPGNTGRPFAMMMAGDPNGPFCGISRVPAAKYSRGATTAAGTGWSPLFGFDTRGHMTTYAAQARAALLSTPLPCIYSNINWCSSRLLDTALFIP